MRGSITTTTVALVVLTTSLVDGFSQSIFAETSAAQRVAQSSEGGVEFELPNFDELFGRIQEVSPLARLAIQRGGGVNGKRGFEAVVAKDELSEWKSIEKNDRRIVNQIDRIDGYQGLGCPIIRFRSSFEGPCEGDAFASFTMDLEARSKWDPSIAEVYERYPINDLDAANVLMGFGKYGDCSRLGVGYCRTKSYLAVSGREQLTLCGIQNMPDGSTIVWGTEMDERHNHLMPEGQRTTRAKSHLFSTTLIPTSPNTFDVEYCLQIDIGGNLPSWITTPILVETIKNQFRYAKGYFAGEGKDGGIEGFLAEKEKKALKDAMEMRNTILMTP